MHDLTTGLAERKSNGRSNFFEIFGRSVLNLPAIVLLLGMAIIAGPTMVFVAQESWSTELGAHGPIVLLTGLWLLARLWPDAREMVVPPDWKRVLGLYCILLPLYVVARITQIVEVEGYLVYGCVLTALYSVVGGAAIKRLWFPLIYIAFIFPPPDTIVAAVTGPLKIWVSQAVIIFLNLLDYPIAGQGVVIYVGQYEMLVAAACSGLNSIIALTSISLFYIYIRHQAEPAYALALVLIILPVALIANFVRVLILILLTYHAGEAAGQGFLHNFAGILMFGVALLTIFALDAILKPAWNRMTKTNPNKERWFVKGSST